MIKDLMHDDNPVHGIFMVKQATKATSIKGANYLSLTLQDASGFIDAKMWTITEEDLQVAQPGALVEIDGVDSMYRGHPQLKVDSLEEVDEASVDMSKYVPTAPVPVETMKKELMADIEEIQDPELKNLTTTLLTENMEAFTTYPAAVTIHHAYYGGLLYHSLSICSMAKSIQEHYPYLNRDYLISGSLLHDIGKTKELSGAKGTCYTDEGNLLGHITLGAMMVYEKGKAMGVDPEKLDVLTHMILAHHGKPEFGSAKVPMTAEAYVLHALDDLDAKMEILRTNYENTDAGAFTGKILSMEGTNFFKPHTFEELADNSKK